MCSASLCVNSCSGEEPSMRSKFATLWKKKSPVASRTKADVAVADDKKYTSLPKKMRGPHGNGLVEFSYDEKIL